ncbi:hypothetical protein GCK32_022826, partial [Trichostrongylus colubriformis]
RRRLHSTETTRQNRGRSKVHRSVTHGGMQATD